MVSLLLALLALALFSFSSHIAQLRTTSTRVESNRASRTLTGSGIGGGVGLASWLVIGTLGVATGGWAFAVGAAAFTLAGVGGGALVGSATSTTTVTVQSLPVYSEQWCFGICALGMALLLLALLLWPNCPAKKS